ncbi:hypothetical protein RHGRI_011588 [Rhododendron griersonianum]|uniref:Protein kinase domain-containing protein n=1 Tax=Rhododendron griersonianum TaxID=479676 RepID=A0AAV6KNG1_9ERIC|nr:hypothetical protein RHGRI_011588 [Rhododendron griersonianum]
MVAVVDRSSMKLLQRTVKLTPLFLTTSSLELGFPLCILVVIFSVSICDTFQFYYDVSSSTKDRMSRRRFSKKRKIPISAKVYTMAELQSATNGLSEENFLGRSSHWTNDALRYDAYMTLSWGQRLRIALGVARALDYLHSTCLPPVSHSNLKAANTLLDEELMPRLSDCGLAVLRPLTSNSVKLKVQND